MKTTPFSRRQFLKTTTVENDPGKFDPALWLDFFKRTKSDAVCLSGGGCVAYYPTQIPFHHRSQWLGELITGYRKLGTRVNWPTSSWENTC